MRFQKTVLISLLFFSTLPDALTQDTLRLEREFTSLEIDSVYIGYLAQKPGFFNLDSIAAYPFVSMGRLTKAVSLNDERHLFRFIIKNHLPSEQVISLSLSMADSAVLYSFNQENQIQKSEKINIRGLDLHGRFQLQPGESKELYLLLRSGQVSPVSRFTGNYFRIHNYNQFIKKELSNRFIDSLLIGLLLFSAVLNLILGLILKRSSFTVLFLYLLTLLVFAFTYLGFYDEFVIRKIISIPIGLPVYFLTLIIFLQLSKNYLQLEKHLPGWNTVTNVLMFFLLISIPYYYITVYIESLYNNFLAFTSLFFIAAAAILGLIESIILFQKESKAKFFLIANLVVVASLSINLFFETRYPVVVGAVIQGFIFTIGLAEEIKLLDRQKIRFQQSYINQLELNLKFKDNATAQLEKKVQERTHELKHANAELITKNRIVEQQKELLEIRSKEIKDSIEYARRIQTASFPAQKILDRLTRDYFILYKPRDIVSGDFYWFGEVENKIVVIAADCTGHGVPGAFMSMYGIAFLNEIVGKEKIFLPSEILDTLRDKIAGSLNRGDDDFETMDGMDMAVLTFDLDLGKLYFAGAFNSLYLIRNETLQIVKADKMPVAFYQKMDPFTNNEIEFTKGDCLYIYTDGLIDQFGGSMGKKFLTKRLNDILTRIHELPMKDQQYKIEDAFNDWKGDYFQVDDILVIGLRI